MNRNAMNRRQFIENSAMAGVGASLVPGAFARAAEEQTASNRPVSKKIKVGVIGCGSVSTKYLPHLAKSSFVELSSFCDIKPERARRAAAQYNVPNHYPHIDQMLSGVPFDLFVDLTDMQEHERLNRQAIEAGKHVWSEKPLANSYQAGVALLKLAKNRGVRLWGAPTVVNSPQFRFMADTLKAGELGKVSAANASYGHLGPDWSAFFYEKGGGSLPDLGVYNLTTLTGLLGPAKSVTAMTSVVTPRRNIRDRGKIKVTAEDNAMVLIDHGDGALSHTQCGFNYFAAEEHDDTRRDHHTITFHGTRGSMSLAGYDWAPYAVDLATADRRAFTRHAEASQDYVWQQGASVVAECLATGKEPPFAVEHALHIVEVMEAARASQETGRRIDIRSTFKWPVAMG